MSIWNQTATPWDTARNWGTNPVLAAPASANDLTLNLSGLATGVIPAGAVFYLAGNQYIVMQAATINGGAAQVQIDPPLAANANANAPLTDFNVIATDADLTQQDSVMPALGKKVVDSQTGKSSYDGKRALVKRDIAAWLSKRNFVVAGVLLPWQFNRAATLLELAYIYQDMSRRNEGIANEKAALFRSMFNDEIESLKFDYVPPVVSDNSQKVQTTAVMWRA